MVCLYLCQACQNGNHGKCELGHPAPKGHYGGSLCRCGCRGNPKFDDPEEIHKELLKQLKDLTEFEDRSRKALEKMKKKPRAKK